MKLGGKKVKVVGTISDEIVDKYKLYPYRGKVIVQSFKLYIHIEKHIKEFKNVNNYYKAIRGIKGIIAYPYFVYYDNLRNSLLYFKQLDENVCVVVKLILKKKTNCYVATLYPISKKKIERYLSMDDKMHK